jgi:hypothetical protein
MEPNWTHTVAHNLAAACAHWSACVREAVEWVEEFTRRVSSEWNVMVKDPLWMFYGGENTPARRRTYIGRRFDEIRFQLTQYLHRPECLALAEALDERRAIEVTN